nr:hypothetical protein [Fredinandcohnia onubensis]
MERKIVCFSAADRKSRENYEKSVLKPIELKELNKKIKVSNIPMEFVSIWGVRWDKIWKDIMTNDIVLFYANRRFISYTTVITKLQSNDISEYLWGTDEYKNLVIMSPIVRIESSREDFWKAFNYAPRLYIQGARIPFIKRQIELVTEYGSIELFLKEALNLDNLNLPKF